MEMQYVLCELRTAILDSLANFLFERVKGTLDIRILLLCFPKATHDLVFVKNRRTCLTELYVAWRIHWYVKWHIATSLM
jgi:hypothetical protein